MLRFSLRVSLWPLLLAGCLPVACWLALWRLYPLSALEQWGQFELRNTPGHFDSPRVRATTLLFLLMWAGYGGAVAWLWRAYRHNVRLGRALPWVGALAVGAVAACATRIYPFTSIDIFYYMCELKLRYFYGANPYTVPFEPRYSADPFAAYSGFTHTTCVYGPAWFWLSWPPVALAGFADLGATLWSYKLWSALWVVGCSLLIWRGTRDERPWLSVALFVLSPLVWLDAVGNGHNDILMAGALLGATLLARQPQGRWAAFSLPLLAVAIGVKPSAAPLAWVFWVWMRRLGWTPRALAVSGALAVAAALILLLPFWESGALAGWRAGVAVSVQPFTSSPLSLVRELLFNEKAPAELQALVRPVCLMMLVALVLASPWLVRRFEPNLAVVLGLTYLLAGSMFPWYLLPIVALLCLRPDRATLIYLVASCGLGLLYAPLEAWGTFDSPLAGHGIQVNLMLAGTLAFPLMLWMWSARGRPQRAAPERGDCRVGPLVSSP